MSEIMIYHTRELREGDKILAWGDDEHIATVTRVDDAAREVDFDYADISDSSTGLAVRVNGNVVTWPTDSKRSKGHNRMKAIRP